MPRTSEKVTMSPLVLKRWSSSGTCRGPKGRTHQSFTSFTTSCTGASFLRFLVFLVVQLLKPDLFRGVKATPEKILNGYMPLERRKQELAEQNGEKDAERPKAVLGPFWR